jgi:hypothetical protein
MSGAGFGKTYGDSAGVWKRLRKGNITIPERLIAKGKYSGMG